MEVMASLSQGRRAAAQCGLFTHKSVPVIFEPPCIILGLAYPWPCGLRRRALAIQQLESRVRISTDKMEVVSVDERYCVRRKLPNIHRH